MQRLIAAIGWFIDALGRYPIEDDFGLWLYRDLEFPRETAWTRTTGQLDEEGEALRRAS